MSKEDNEEFSKRLIEKYGINAPSDVIASVYTPQPKLRILMSRSSFRAEALHTVERVRRERRNFLRNMIGLVAVSVPILVWLKVAFFSPSTQTPSYVSNPGSQNSSGRLLANAQSIPVGESITLDDPSLGPFLLIHLNSGQFVAYSATCTHAGCQVQFDPSTQDIACPCHGAVYDPSHGAEVLAGPAPYPLQQIPIRYDQSTENIYL